MKDKLVNKYFWAFMVLVILVGFGIGLLTSPVVTGEAGRGSGKGQGVTKSEEAILKNWGNMNDQAKEAILKAWYEESVAEPLAGHATYAYCSKPVAGDCQIAYHQTRCSYIRCEGDVYDVKFGTDGWYYLDREAGTIVVR